MEMATYLVAAVVVEGLPVRQVAREHGVSKTWLYELVARYEAEGEAGLVPRSKRPHRSPTKVGERFEDEIVRIRKELDRGGLRRRGRNDPHAPASRPPADRGPFCLDHLAGAQGPRLRRPRAPQATQVLVPALRG